MAGAAVAGLSQAVEAFGVEALAAARAALADTPPHDVEIAGVPIRFRSTVPALMESLAVHPVTTRAPACELLVLDDATAGGRPPRPPWRNGDYLPGDQVAGVDEDSRMQAAYLVEFAMLSLFDRETATGVCWVQDAARLPRWERIAPLRALLHWVMRDAGLTFTHAAAVGTSERGALLVGTGGRGKSTTALAAYLRGLSLVGDDYCVLGPGPTAHALYGIAKVRPAGLTRLPELRDRVTPFPEGDYRFDVSPVAQLPVNALVLPRVVPGGRTRLVEAPASEALLGLGPSTTFQLPGAPSRTVATLAALTRELPTYWLDLWNNPDGAVAALRELLAC